MTDAKAIATAYIATWNETDSARRERLLNEGWVETARYVDPIMAGAGRSEISGLIGGVHERFPGFRFALKGQPDGHGEQVRFSWTLGPDGIEAPIEGTDFVTVAEGRIAAVTGFLDKVPAA